MPQSPLAKSIIKVIDRMDKVVKIAKDAKQSWEEVLEQVKKKDKEQGYKDD